MLFIFAGLPGTGKTTLARELARHRRAAYVRIDTIEETLRAADPEWNGPEGYAVAYAVAADNLRLGLAVVADSVNPLRVTRRAWHAVAAAAGVAAVDIEVVCSDPAEHRRRVETREAHRVGLRPLTWAQVCGREYELWETPVVRVNTAGQSIEQSVVGMLAVLKSDASA